MREYIRVRQASERRTREREREGERAYIFPSLSRFSSLPYFGRDRTNKRTKEKKKKKYIFCIDAFIFLETKRRRKRTTRRRSSLSLSLSLSKQTVVLNRVCVQNSKRSFLLLLVMLIFSLFFTNVKQTDPSIESRKRRKGGIEYIVPATAATAVRNMTFFSFF